jgi:UV DNA damage endonuclease
MKIGYPCVNRTIGCTPNSTLRLASFTEEKFLEKVINNLSCLLEILKFNVKHGLFFFRISSDIIPFASHPVCECAWESLFRSEFKSIGGFIKKNNIRISMHPDQFVVLNSKKESVVKNSVSELYYHCILLDAMGLPETAKVQIHAGGVYGDAEEAMKRFVLNYNKLDRRVKKRLVIENDDKSYSLKDCVFLSGETGIPVVFDVLHHECLGNGESIKEAMGATHGTWMKKDGIPIVDYSIQRKGARAGMHAESIDLKLFEKFLKEAKEFDFDIMLEIKDKEKSALKAVKLVMAEHINA